MKHSPTLPNCQHALLARSAVGHVSVCPDCGVVLLTKDSVSVRLEVSAFVALAAMVSQAQQRSHGVQSHEDNAHPESAYVAH